MKNIRFVLTALLLVPVVQSAVGFEAGVRPNAYPTADEARVYFSGKTTKTFSLGHGTQISYYAPNGMTYLWYPGNAVVLPGRWYIEEREPFRSTAADHKRPVMLPRNLICFVYGANTYSPVTRQPGGSPECTMVPMFQVKINERRPGDIFGLSARARAPFVLSSAGVPTFDQLLKQMR